MVRRTVPASLLVAASMVLPAGSAWAGTSESPASLTPANDSAHALEWTGSVGPNTPVAGASSHSHFFRADLGEATTAKATVWIEWDTSEDLKVDVFDATTGEAVPDGNSDDLPGEAEIASFDVRNGKVYEVRTGGFLNGQTSFRGRLWARSVSGRNFTGGSGDLRYARPELVAQPRIPVNIVFIGFDPMEVEANRQRVLDQLPPAFRPVIRTKSDLSGGTLRRRKATSAAIATEPIKYTYDYNVIVTDEAYNRRLFAAAKDATASGEYSLPFDRDYIERYNARAGVTRGADRQVAPGSPIDFIDGVELEDWVAANPPAGLSFDLDDPAEGYTYFVIDSFRPSYAEEYFDLNRYHHFRVMNESTVDPDSGVQNGFDWGRVWGGRYRFLMLDVGAGPNSWEGAVTLANTKIFRLEGNGDSSAFDPPIWEYGTEVAPFYDVLGEDVQYAMWMRFTRGYLYPPRPFDNFLLAANTWHDHGAYTPWPSRLEMLYKDRLVIDQYQDLVPYSNIDGFSRFKYLTPDDDEQKAIDAGKRRSLMGQPVPFTVNTRPTMDLINRNRDTYAPLRPATFTVPVVNVVFEHFYTWALPAVVGGIAEGEGGEPWGQLQNVNNRTKWPGATGTVTDSAGHRHDPTIPDSRVEGVDNVARFGFTSTTLHEAGHFLGLSHNHDAVAYDWTNDVEVERPNEDPTLDEERYYNTIDWMYTTTATPMGYGWSYHHFEVLDKDNVWIGHAAEWLDQSYDNLVDAFAALDSAGIKKATGKVREAVEQTEGLITQARSALEGGRYLDAVTTARSALTAGENAVRLAARKATQKG